MTKKVKLAIFDKDLRARTYENFPLSTDGSRISVRRGGKRNFNPTFDQDSYIEFPSRSLMPPFRIKWNRVYFARNGAKACVNFKTEKVSGPDSDLVMEAAEAEILKGIGKDKQETPLILYIILAAVIFTLLKVLGVIA